jgi:hypothetical protein
VDRAEFLRRELALRHVQFLLALTSSTESVFPLSLYQNSLCIAKGVLPSSLAKRSAS